jgi:hypothetical protein
MRERVLFATIHGYERWAFVPAERGRYIRTHRCALNTACPKCSAAPGHPCLDLTRTDGVHFQVKVHAPRRDAFYGRQAEADRRDLEGARPILRVRKGRARA